MNFKRKIASMLAGCMIVGAFSAVAMAASTSLDGDRCTWYGGIEKDKEGNKIIYSKVWDHKQDGIRYNVTVWVKNDRGDTDYRTRTTSGIDADGEVIITKRATYSNPIVPNKSGYKNFSIVY